MAREGAESPSPKSGQNSDEAIKDSSNPEIPNERSNLKILSSRRFSLGSADYVSDEVITEKNILTIGRKINPFRTKF